MKQAVDQPFQSRFYKTNTPQSSRGRASSAKTPAQSLLQKMSGKQTQKQRPRGGGGRKGRGAGGGTGGGGTGGFYSPELEKLKHSYLTHDWFKRIDEPVGLSDRERQGIYNLAKRQKSGALQSAIDSMRDELGEAGWKPGESGIADAILGKMRLQGAESLGQKAQEIALNERNRRFLESLQLEGLNLDKMGMGLSAMTSAGGLEQFIKKLKQQQRQFGAGMGLSRKKFEYGKEMDALNMLMNLARYGQQNQATAWSPYWAGMSGLS